MTAINSPTNSAYSSTGTVQKKKTAITVSSPLNPLATLTLYELRNGRISYSDSKVDDEETRDALHHAAAVAWARAVKAKKLQPLVKQK